MKRAILFVLRRTHQAMLRAWLTGKGIEMAPGVALGSGVDCSRGVARGTAGSIRIGAACEVCRGAVLHAYGGGIELSERVYVGPYTVIYGHGGVKVGESTLISMHCRILSSNHTIPAPGIEIRSQPDILLPTIIGRDVWLGAGVTVAGGVTIGDGCVVGAGAVVTRDLPPNTISVGVPAHVVRARS